MSKFLIIPDVHGRAFWKYARKHIDEYDKVIFLGDYLDPYPYEGISFEEAVANFNEILKFKQENEDEVVLLLGNHDMHYYDLNFMDCSRLNRKRRGEMCALYTKFENYFQLAYIADGCLFTHAGVYKSWVEQHEIDIKDLCQSDLVNNYIDSLEEVSCYRGGWADTGSCIWADIRESGLYELDDTYYQIVGHTQLNNHAHITDKIACLDVRRCFELDTETKKITDIAEQVVVEVI